MRIIPVLDLLNGIVVRGVGGRRHEYQPIQSVLTSSVDPVQVADALIEAFSPMEIYVADLDAILSGEFSPRVIVDPRHRVTVWLDAGVRDAVTARRVAESGCQVVAGLETVESPGVLREIVEAVTPEKVVFSLDLKGGVPLRTWPGVAEPLSIAREAVNAGVQRMIILDLVRVGESGGTGTNELCRCLANEFPGLDLIAGGGITSSEGIDHLAGLGVRGVLLASALHDGRISPTRAKKFSKT